MSPEFSFSLLRVNSVRDLAACRLEPGVAEVYPDPHPCPLSLLSGHERDLRILLFQVFVDDGGFVNDRVAVNQDRDLAIRIQLQELPRLVLEIDLDQIVRDLFFRQDNPSPVGIGSGMTGKKSHRYLQKPCSSLVLVPPPPLRTRARTRITFSTTTIFPCPSSHLPQG